VTACDFQKYFSVNNSPNYQPRALSDLCIHILVKTPVFPDLWVSEWFQTTKVTLRSLVFVVFHRYLSKVADFNIPHLHLAPPLGMTPFEFQISLRSLATENSSPRAIVRRCLRDPRYSRFDTIPGVTDRHTVTQR